VLERPLTAPRLHFKGAGWYVNDYAAKSSAPAGESASTETKAPEAKTESTPSTSAAPAATPSAATESSTAATGVETT